MAGHGEGCPCCGSPGMGSGRWRAGMDEMVRRHGFAVTVVPHGDGMPESAEDPVFLYTIGRGAVGKPEFLTLLATAGEASAVAAAFNWMHAEEAAGRLAVTPGASLSLPFPGPMAGPWAVERPSGQRLLEINHRFTAQAATYLGRPADLLVIDRLDRLADLAGGRAFGVVGGRA